jgi:hypothetical protein
MPVIIVIFQTYIQEMTVEIGALLAFVFQLGTLWEKINNQLKLMH